MLSVHQYAGERNGVMPNVEWNPASPNYDHSFFTAIFPYFEKQKLVYISPADPTFANAVEHDLSSYAANGMVFINNARFPLSIPDGTSQTIGFAEHYAECKGDRFDPWWTISSPPNRRNATFADSGSAGPDEDDGSPPVDRNGIVLTFQVAPALTDCDPSVPQTPHRSGMLCAYMDGSVRVMGPNVSPAVFWGAVTPAGGEILPLD
jgi:hypothetical protein